MKKVTLTWYAPSSPNVSGYKILYGNTTKEYTLEKDVGNVLSGSIEIDSTQPVYAAVVAYNSFGINSPLSTEVTDNIAPASPTGVRITKIEMI